MYRSSKEFTDSSFMFSALRGMATSSPFQLTVSPEWLNDKEAAARARDVGLIPGSGRSPGEGNDHPTPGFLPGKSHRQRSLAGYSP